MKNNLNTVIEEAKLAYADFDEKSFTEGEGYRIRKLEWKASLPLSKEDAAKVMSVACSGGYNEFKPYLLNKLPDDSKVWLARESSVCVYVKTKQKLNKDKFNADECDLESPNMWRLWWD